jgi:hypothetical protein
VRSDCRSSVVGTVHLMSRANDLTDMQEEVLDSGDRGTQHAPDLRRADERE